MFSLLSTFKKLCDNSLSQVQYNEFVIFCINISLTYVEQIHKRLRRKLKHYPQKNEDLAIDGVSELFTKDKESNRIHIVKAFQNWQPPITNEDEALYFLNILIGQRVEQHVTHLVRVNDPYFSKIYSAISHQIANSDLQKFSVLGTIYIARKSDTQISLQLIPQADFYNLPSHIFLHRKQYVTDILDYLESETAYEPAIPLNDLVYKIKSIFLSDISTKERYVNPFTELTIDEYLNEAVKDVYNRLDAFYAKNGKLRPDEVLFFKKVFQHVSNDVQRQSRPEKGYYYFKKEITELSLTTYQTQYQSIYEYLLRTMKSTIQKLIKLDNSL